MLNTVASPLIDLNSVKKAYKTDAGLFLALKGIDLHVNAGEYVAIVGKSGSGKTTLINMITGLDRPTEGEILVGGEKVETLGENQLAIWRGRTIGVVFQFFQLLPTLTALENVMLPMDFCGTPAFTERRDRAHELLCLMEIEEQANKLPAKLSGGQQQRVAIARALATDPPILAADEPTGNLDSKTAEAVFSLFERLASLGKTILVVTHDPDLARRASRQLHISDGAIVSDVNDNGGKQPGRSRP
ncbi:MAG: ABC transporter ATP-binding protein [Anaerolineales bacterium]|jgi:putative ABC transport system ATP-binding protein|nr:ABC transporter ATP-binding protein [Anaerolineales bacterium]